eukprot:2602150-Amphidinium_carterae.1
MGDAMMTPVPELPHNMFGPLISESNSDGYGALLFCIELVWGVRPRVIDVKEVQRLEAIAREKTTELTKMREQARANIILFH